jgi:putative ABC transport system permease protein
MQNLSVDVRSGLRALRKTPNATALACLTLTLGIGATSAIFSIINSILIRPLPYQDAQRLVVVSETTPTKSVPVSPPDYQDFLAQNTVFERMGVFRSQPVILTGNDLPEQFDAAVVSTSLFQLLGVRFRVGRAFEVHEDQPSEDLTAILSDGLWRRRFGADPNVLGSSLRLDGERYTVIGIAPAEFRLPDSTAELWIPYRPEPKELSPLQRGLHSLTLLARLKPGVTRRQAEIAVQSIAGRIARNYPDTNAGYSAAVTPFRDSIVGDIRPLLWILAGAVAFVLMIACANVANLQLVRAGVRTREFAVRAALGASPARIVWQLVTESVLLASAGGLLGFALAYGATAALVKLAPPDLPQVSGTTPDAWVLAFTLVLSVITGVLFGLAPALASARSDLNVILRASGRGVAGGRSRTRNALAIGEIAACLVLLIGMGLLVRTLVKLQMVNPGFRTNHVLTMRIVPPAGRYTGSKIALFYERVLDQVKALPGASSAGICSFLPLGGNGNGANFQIEGQPSRPAADQPRANFRAASVGYFGALGIPLLKGRDFELTDGAQTRKVVIINQAAAQRYWPNEDPIGKRILSGLDETEWSTIIGVIGNVKYARLDAATGPETYYHYLQIPPERMNLAEASMAVVLRTNADPAAMISSVRKAVQTVDPGQAVIAAKTMEDVVRGSLAQARFRTMLFAAFAGLALMLAAIGLYGVIASSVSQRVNELGARIALGAQTGDILKLVVGQGLRLALIGIAIGLVLALGVSRAIARFLFGISPLDPITLGAALLVILGVTLCACAVPAFRAAKVDPAIALRAE